MENLHGSAATENPTLRAVTTMLAFQVHLQDAPLLYPRSRLRPMSLLKRLLSACRLNQLSNHSMKKRFPKPDLPAPLYVVGPEKLFN